MAGTIYTHPLAYLLGLEGVALLRAFAGEHDQEFVQARFDEIRRLLDAADELGDGVEVHEISTAEGYAGWAEFYDEPGNDMIDREQPVVRGILDGLPTGLALDAACGTGRHAAYLAGLGHRVIGIDSSEEMLQLARRKVSDGEFLLGELEELPLPDDHVDLVVCGLAIMHVPELDPVFDELVRVLRPGGHLVISDGRGLVGKTRLPVVKLREDGTAGYMPTYGRLASEYLAAGLARGFRLLRCEEPRRPEPLLRDDDPPPEHIAGEPPNVWALHPLAPDASNAAYRDTPIAIVMHFRFD